MKTAIEDVLDQLPEGPYSKSLYDKTCAVVYQYFYDSYSGEDRSVYAAMSSST
jgi:hypothetical protein